MANRRTDPHGQGQGWRDYTFHHRDVGPAFGKLTQKCGRDRWVNAPREQSRQIYSSLELRSSMVYIVRWISYFRPLLPSYFVMRFVLRAQRHGADGAMAQRRRTRRAEQLRRRLGAERLPLHDVERRSQLLRRGD